jgi:hypothetical protein
MERVNTDLCGKVVQHCHAWITEFMKSNAGGSLNRFANLDALIAASDSEVSANDIALEANQTAPTDATDEEEED